MTSRGFIVWGWGFRGLEFGGSGSYGLKVEGLGFRVWGGRFRVKARDLGIPDLSFRLLCDRGFVIFDSQASFSWDDLGPSLLPTARSLMDVLLLGSAWDTLTEFGSCA